MVELVAKKPRDSERQIAFIKVDGIEFSVGNVPMGLSTDTKILNWLKKNEDFYKFLILQKQYPGADWQRYKTEENDNYSALKIWIKAGHKNLIGKDGRKYIYEVIEKQELEYRHPKWIGLVAKIDASSIDSKIKELLKEIIKD